MGGAGTRDVGKETEMDAVALSLGELARRCREETSQYLRGDSTGGAFCFEIFRRAIREREERAWEAVFAQYRGMVLAWVHRHPAWRTGREEDAYWTNRAFERFWVAVTPERFATFPNIASLLRYLKLCTHSVLLDDARARRAASFQSLDDRGAGEAAETGDIAETTIGNLTGNDLWRVIEAELRDETERRVAYLSFVLGLKPRVIAEAHPELFGDVADVYRLKRSLLDRLQRNAAIRQFLE